MVHLFDDGTFHKYEFNSKVGLHLKYLRDQYRSQLERVRSHEHHPSIPEMEWRVLMAYAHEKALWKEGKTPPGPERYEACLIM